MKVKLLHSEKLNLDAITKKLLLRNFKSNRLKARNYVLDTRIGILS